LIFFYLILETDAYFKLPTIWQPLSQRFLCFYYFWKKYFAWSRFKTVDDKWQIKK